MTTNKRPPDTTTLALLALLWLTGVYLRLPVLVAPPLAPYIAADLQLTQTAIGALTTMPLLMLALGSLPAAALIARLGARTTLVLATVLVVAGSAARGLAPPAALLFVATAVMGFGIAAMQPALPSLVPRWCPRHIALGSAVYMNGMLLGEFIGAGLTLPVLMPLTGDDWRLALLVWSLPGLLVAAALTRPQSVGPARRRSPRWQPEWRAARVWQTGALLGGAGTVFFGTNAYMGSVLTARGEGAQLADSLLVFNLMQVLASLAMIAFGRRLVAQRAPIIATSIANTLGLLGFMAMGDLPGLVAVAVMGFCSAIQLILLVSLPPQVTHPDAAGRFAAGMFTIGYLIAFLVPLLGGALADLVGEPVMALLPIVVYAGFSTLAAFVLDVRPDDPVSETAPASA